ncbi:MAG: hypothetical protein JWQ44_2930 [Chthoniobacter sp.]|nr:hypothetical protein [Chthoniobacter sp.]
MAIHETDDGFVCSSCGSYIVGVYESRRACNMAFRTPDYLLSAIWKTKFGPDGTVPLGVYITEDDLRKAKPPRG